MAVHDRPAEGAALAQPVAIVGLGVIGGSLALALHARGVSIRGFAASTEDRKAASQAGLDVLESLTAAVRDAAIVVLCIPLDQLRGIVRDLPARREPGGVVYHTAGIQQLERIGLSERERAMVLGTHPLAGSHASGFAGSRVELFRGATVSVESRGSPADRVSAARLWTIAGAARVIERDAALHDEMMAWVTHLPQLASTAVAAVLEGRQLDTGDVGPGARSVTRLATSSAAMWMPLLAAAPPATIEALRILEVTVAELRQALERRDMAAVGAVWARAAGWRQVRDEPA